MKPKRLLRFPSLIVYTLIGVFFGIDGLTGRSISIGDGLFVVACALILAALTLGERIVTGAQELGTAHVAAERIRSSTPAAPAPEMPDLGELLAGVFGGAADPAATEKEIQDRSEAATAANMEMYRGTVPLEVVLATVDGKPRGFLPPEMLTDEERASGKITDERLAEVMDSPGVTTRRTGDERASAEELAMVETMEADRAARARGFAQRGHGGIVSPDFATGARASDDDLDNGDRIPPF